MPEPIGYLSRDQPGFERDAEAMSASLFIIFATGPKRKGSINYFLRLEREYRTIRIPILNEKHLSTQMEKP